MFLPFFQKTTATATQSMRRLTQSGFFPARGRSTPENRNVCVCVRPGKRSCCQSCCCCCCCCCGCCGCCGYCCCCCCCRDWRRLLVRRRGARPTAREKKNATKAGEQLTRIRSMAGGDGGGGDGMAAHTSARSIAAHAVALHRCASARRRRRRRWRRRRAAFFFSSRDHHVANARRQQDGDCADVVVVESLGATRKRARRTRPSQWRRFEKATLSLCLSLSLAADSPTHTDTDDWRRRGSVARLGTDHCQVS